MEFKKNQLKKGKTINYVNLDEPSKLGPRSQTRNLLNSRPRINQEARFLTNLILIRRSISNKEQQTKTT